VIPNGIYVSRYRNGVERPEWSGHTLGFIGRYQEPRKGLSVLLEALPKIIDRYPDTQVFVAGPGNPTETLAVISPELRQRFQFLGRISEEEKADFLASVGLYIAPNTGGESFGIILTEALASGASVVASDIPAFDSLLGHGKYGTLFQSENSRDLAEKIIWLFQNSAERDRKALLGKEFAQNFDWDVVAEKIFDVYEMAMVGGQKVSLTSENRAWNRLLGRD
jgi:phosphatidylinositol alpha-mannosyltransferase